MHSLVGMERIYKSDPLSDPAFFSGCTNNDAAFKNLVFALTFFHCVVVGRRWEMGNIIGCWVKSRGAGAFHLALTFVRCVSVRGGWDTQ